MNGVHIIWFRNDLRVHDHAALKAAHLACERDGGRVVPLFISTSQLDETPYVAAALRDLDQALAQRGAELHYRTGDAIECLSDIHAAHRILSLHVHETLAGDEFDRAVEAWSLRAGVPFRVHEQFRPDMRSNEASDHKSARQAFLTAPRHEAPSNLSAVDIGLGRKPYLQQQGSGGRKQAIECLRTGLGRVADLTQIGAPGAQSGDDLFDELKPHLDLGVLSVREVWQAAISAQQQYFKAGHEIRATRVASFISRLSELQPEGRIRHLALHHGVARGILVSIGRTAHKCHSIYFARILLKRAGAAVLTGF